MFTSRNWLKSSSLGIGNYMVDDAPEYCQGNHRIQARLLQNAYATAFTDRLTLVLKETARVLREEGLLVPTYHDARREEWYRVLDALPKAGFYIATCHPVKAELSLATPKHQAKSPSNFDVILVCRKANYRTSRDDGGKMMSLASATERAKSQIKKLINVGFKLSRNDVGVVVMAQVIAPISRNTDPGATKKIIGDIPSPVAGAMGIRSTTLAWQLATLNCDLAIPLVPCPVPRGALPFTDSQPVAPTPASSPKYARYLPLTRLSDGLSYPTVELINSNTRRNQKPREAPRPHTEDSTPKPVPTAHAQARGSSRRRSLSSPRVPCPFPTHPGDGRSTTVSGTLLTQESCRSWPRSRRAKKLGLYGPWKVSPVVPFGDPH